MDNSQIHMEKIAEKTIHYYDLDGTLSTLNSTFDFIEGYLRHSNKFFRLYLTKIIMVTLMRTGNYDPYRSRNLVIILLFKGLQKSKLEKYFEEHYKKKFLNSLTPLGKELLERPETADVLLTGCTEIPAKQIALLFGFKTLISTEFYYKKEKIDGIKTDTYGSNKSRFLEKGGDRTVYYTDDLDSEKSLIPLMDEIVEVKYP
ncbi:HAD family hydrolase [Salegentibacter sp. F188]|uniref:HAD family hydrolase n=1 Tax=Autumnicola patrickiae TaxID=3075591 RepID=A0ABU3E4D9_9FLAO|nr:HAD family hydrolase [Salegentibacter sp. F188]MDT0690858.1 HAD family hydrolase [Salegentibacter sp. F188]